MWMLNNRTAYAAERNWTRDKDGLHLWIVAVRATFDISAEGRLTLSDEQPPPVLAPEYRGDPAKTSLREDSDLLAEKVGTDVLVDACAHAPNGRATGTVPVSLRVGELTKSLVVHGVRIYYKGATGLAISSPKPFEKHPIVYESAFGGTDTSHVDQRKHAIDGRNPVGRGFAVNPSRLENQIAHSVEYPRGDPSKAGPAGFGPLASFWSPRLERAGTYDQAWEKSKKPLLPDDYDERFALSAPDDQRPAKPLRGGETVVIVNMTPEGTLSFALPKIFLAFSTRIQRRTEEHRAKMTSVFLALEQRTLSLVWQSVLRVPSREVDYLDHTSIDEKRYIT